MFGADLPRWFVMLSCLVFYGLLVYLPYYHDCLYVHSFTTGTLTLLHVELFFYFGVGIGARAVRHPPAYGYSLVLKLASILSLLKAIAMLVYVGIALQGWRTETSFGPDTDACVQHPAWIIEHVCWLFSSRYLWSLCRLNKTRNEYEQLDRSASSSSMTRNQSSAETSALNDDSTA